MKIFRLLYENPIGQALLLLVFTFLAYANSFGIEPFGDDYSRIVQAMTHYNEGFFSALNHTLPNRPITVLSVWLNLLLAGESGPALRAVNLLLHAATGFTLLIVMRGVLRMNVPGAVIGSLIFVTHPALNQTVNLVIQRGVILATLFGLLSLLWFHNFLESKKRKFLVGSCIFYLLGLLSKPIILFLPLIFLLYEVLVFKSSRTRTLRWYYLVFGVLALVPAVLHFGLEIDLQKRDISPWTYFLTELGVQWIYLKLFLFPYPLHYFYEITASQSLFEIKTLLALFGHILVIGAALLYASKTTRFLILAVYIAFMAESGFFPIDYFAFEHRIYFPLSFFAMLIGNTIDRWQPRAGFSLSITTLILAAMIVLNLRRNEEIKTSRGFILNTLKHYSRNHDYNHDALSDLLRARDFASGREASQLIPEAFKTRFAYPIYRDVFEFDQLSETEQKSLLQKLNHFLGSPSTLPSLTRISLIAFLLEERTRLRTETNLTAFVQTQMSRVTPYEKNLEALYATYQERIKENSQDPQ